jgi:hypothetical protein
MYWRAGQNAGEPFIQREKQPVVNEESPSIFTMNGLSFTATARDGPRGGNYGSSTPPMMWMTPLLAGTSTAT